MSQEFTLSARAQVGIIKRLQPQKAGRPDDFQTPAEKALPPILPWLPRDWTIWEPAAGKGNLVRGLAGHGYDVIESDVRDGIDFLTDDPPVHDCSVTNPPYSIKSQWVARCYEIGMPFALLVPLTIFDSIRNQRLFRTSPPEVIFFPYRINFETPSGRSKGGSWFMTCWLTHGLGIGRDLTFWTPPAAQGTLIP